MIRKAFSIILLLLALTPIVANLKGWDLYTYYQTSDRDYIIGAERGCVYLGNHRHRELSFDAVPEDDDWPTIKRDDKEILNLGSIVIFAWIFPCDSDPGFLNTLLFNFRPFNFGMKPIDEYAYIEFPLLLLLAVTLLIILVLNHGELTKHRKANKA